MLAYPCDVPVISLDEGYLSSAGGRVSRWTVAAAALTEPRQAGPGLSRGSLRTQADSVHCSLAGLGLGVRVLSAAASAAGAA